MTISNDNISSGLFDESVYVKTGRTLDKDERLLFIDEALFLSRIYHPHIVLLRDCGLNEKGNHSIVLEKLNRISDLPSDIFDTTESKAELLASALNVIDFLAHLNFSHGDIKPEHLMFDSTGKCKLIDFAQVYSLSSSALIGTSAYFAPELFWKYGYSLQSDLFSLGLSLMQLFYPSETFANCIHNYGSSLRPWTENDLMSVLSAVTVADPLCYALCQMISYSPLSRPKSGREIVNGLIEIGVITWPIEEYDSKIEEALRNYVERTHWLYVNNVILVSKRKSTFNLRECHGECKSSFLHSLNIFSSFMNTSKEVQKKINWSRFGASICKLKYYRGALPRKFPSSIALPSTFDLERCLNVSAKGLTIKCDHEFLISYSLNKPNSNLTSKWNGNITHDIQSIEKLVFQRNFERAGRIVKKLLKANSLGRDSQLLLNSYLAFCVCHTDNANKAQSIIEDFQESEINKFSVQAFCEYYLTLAWCSFMKGENKKAAKQLSYVLKRIRKHHRKPDSLLVKTYNRIATLKWKSNGIAAALYYINKALRLSKLIECIDELTLSLLLNKSLILGDCGRYSEEAEVHHQIFLLIKKTENSPLVTNYLHNFGIFCLRTGKYELGNLVLKRAYVLALSSNSLKSEIPNHLLTLGNAFFSLGKVRNAYSAWLRGAKQFERQSGIYGAAKCMQNLSELSLLLGKESKASMFLQKASKKYEMINHKVGLIDIELIKFWYFFDISTIPKELKRVIAQCQQLKYSWGLYQALNLQAIMSLTKRDWVQFSKCVSSLEILSKDSSNQFITSDLRYLRKLCKFVRSIHIGLPEDDIWNRLWPFTVANSQLSYRVRSPDISYLDYALEFKGKKTNAIAKLEKEASVVGRIMKSGRKNIDSSNASFIKNSVYRNHLKAINEIAKIVAENKDAEQYAQKVLDKTVETLQASRAVIFITSKYCDEIEVLASSGCQKKALTDIKNVSRTLVRFTLSGNSIFIRDTASAEDFDNVQSLLAKKIKSAICIPLKRDKEIFGLIYVDSLYLATHFEDLDKDFLDAIGSIIAGGVLTSKRMQKLNSYYEKTVTMVVENELSPSGGKLLPSSEMREIYQKISKVAKTDISILLLGQSGSGKEVLAKIIHAKSAASEGPMVAINCSAIPGENLEAELFGVADSAFTGVAGRLGKFELANGGTIFLDEIADMPLNLQAKLLRVIDTKEVDKLGAAKSTKLQFRLISATNKDIREMVKIGEFREDLYYRINDHIIEIPPLCKRPADIMSLIDYFFQYYQNQIKEIYPPLSQDLVTALLAYKWPGGIRELSKVIGGLILLSDSPNLTVDDLPQEIKVSISGPPRRIKQKAHNDKMLDKDPLYNHLRQNKFSIRKTARQLNMPESTLRNHIKKHNIQISPSRLRS